MDAVQEGSGCALAGEGGSPRARDLRTLFAPPGYYRLDKLCELEAALRTHVRPGMTLHFGYNQARPMALSNALVRVFGDTNPAFTIIAAGLVANQAAMFSTRIIKKLIVSFVGENYPAPSPNRIMQAAIDSGAVEIENQSLLVIAQRLAAGAAGFPFALTRSLRDSSMAEPNCFRAIEDPFGSGESIGAVAALVPDITLVHALAADRQGNLLIAPPLGEGEAAAFAAAQGIIATAERIVSPDVIRRFSHLAVVPSHRVLSVSEVPMGCHPYGIYGPPGLGGGYVEDYEFFAGLHSATKSPETFARWVSEWILEVGSHEAYLAKLGRERLCALRGATGDAAWEEELTDAEIAAARVSAEDAVDRMVVAAARVVEERVKANGRAIIGSGVGYANLAAWLAASVMQQRDGLPVELVAEIGLYGFFPKPGEPFIFSNRNISTCKSLTTAQTVLGLHVSGRHNRCLAIVGAAQIDRMGNINSTYAGNGRFLLGSGGANDIASAAAEVIVVAPQSTHRLVEKVPYVTSIGERVSALVTDRGIFEKRGGKLVLTRILECSGADIHAALEGVRATCGWALEVSDELTFGPRPTPDELFRLRLYDPRREFLTATR